MTAFSRHAAARHTNLLLSCLLALGLLSTLALPAPALAINDDPVLRRMDNVLEENARLREDAWKGRKSRDAAAQRQLDEALTASEERVEKTRAEALAHVANVSPAQVESLRKDGRSWGQAAEELGVHPGFLGIGKAPIYEPASVRKAVQAERAEKAKAAQPKGKRGKKKAGDAPDKAVKKSGKRGAKELAKAKPAPEKAEKAAKPAKKKKRKKAAD